MTKLKKESVPFAFIYQSNREAGFTLVELAVVIVIIGLLATMGLSALNVQQANAAVSATKKNQDTIEDALIGYLGRNKRLPCPAVDISGGSDTTARNMANPPSNCITNWGLVPYVELGLPKSVAVDGWGNFFTYAVSPQWTASLNTINPSAGDITNIAANAFNVGNSGTITVDTRANGIQSTLTTSAVVALISSGLNGSGAYTSKGTQNVAPLSSSTDESNNALPQPALPLKNVPLPPSFYQRDFTDNAAPTGGAFDDIVLWFSPGDLVNPLIKDGSIKSSGALVAELADQVTNIQNQVVSQILTDCRFPAAPSTNGPLGEPIGFAYTNIIFINIISVAPPNNKVSFANRSNPEYNMAMYTLTDAYVNYSIPSAPKVKSLFAAYPNLSSQCP